MELRIGPLFEASIISQDSTLAFPHRICVGHRVTDHLAKPAIVRLINPIFVIPRSGIVL